MGRENRRHALEDIKARDITLLDVRKLTSLYGHADDRHAESNRQVNALALHVRDAMKAAGAPIVGARASKAANGSWSTAPILSCTSCSQPCAGTTTSRSCGRHQRHGAAPNRQPQRSLSGCNAAARGLRSSMMSLTVACRPHAPTSGRLHSLSLAEPRAASLGAPPASYETPHHRVRPQITRLGQRRVRRLRAQDAAGIGTRVDRTQTRRAQAIAAEALPQMLDLLKACVSSPRLRVASSSHSTSMAKRGQRQNSRSSARMASQRVRDRVRHRQRRWPCARSQKQCRGGRRTIRANLAAQPRPRPAGRTVVPGGQPAARSSIPSRMSKDFVLTERPSAYLASRSSAPKGLVAPDRH